ncbi:MAG: tRNA 4-thiouridine(8) synthase ThiI [Clostridiales bacterium]|nr:tRNA 4-thiouridine(8) synthase ThiI [Clostridiales bacterium]
MDIQNVLIVRYGEIALKGMNRPYFEKALIRRLRRVIGSGDAAARPFAPTVENAEGLIIVRGYPQDKELTFAKRLLRVFGVASVSPAWELASRNQEDVNEAAVAWMERRLDDGAGGLDAGSLGTDGSATVCTDRPHTFKVFGKRADKSWPLTSPEIAALTGEAVLEALGESRVKVDVSDPEIRLYVHLRRKNVLVYDDMLKGFGGLPLGTNGKGLVLLSGGIDSPVAAWMMAKRGMTIEAVHFHSYPYTSKRAEEKVKDLADVLASYCGRIKVHMLNILPAQEALAEACPEEEMTVLVRRVMVRIASRVAEREGCAFLITGENLGQVASQTAEGIAVTDRASPLPVLRPLIAMDKVDIMDRAREIETYEISIQPYEDCCTVFLPKHPVTRPAAAAIEASEGLLGQDRIAALEDEVMETEEVYVANV